MSKSSKGRAFRYRINAYDGQHDSNQGHSSSEYGSCSQSEDSSGDARAGLQRIDTPPSHDMNHQVDNSADEYPSQNAHNFHDQYEVSIGSQQQNNSGAETESSTEHPQQNPYHQQVNNGHIEGYQRDADVTEDESDRDDADDEDDGEDTVDEDDEYDRTIYVNGDDNESAKLQDTNDGGSTQSDTDDVNEDARDDGGETEEESDVVKHEDIFEKDNQHADSNGSIWSRCEPIVVKAVKILEEKNAQPKELAYARLVGSGKGAVDFYVRSTSLVIGRMGYDADCQLKSEGKHVSKRHARLEWHQQSDQWVITCLSTKNGLVVDGTPIVPSSPPMPLQHNSFLEIGDVSLFFMLPTETIFRVNDIELLRETISSIRASQNDWDSSGEGGSRRRGSSGSHRGRGKKKGKRGMKKENTPYGKKGSSKSKVGSSSRNDKGGSAHKRGKGSGHRGERADGGESTFSDSEPEDYEIPDILDDPKYRLPPKSSKMGKRKLSPSESESQGKKKKRRGKHEDGYGSPDEYDSGNGCEDWNKKERSDFARALFTVGVDPVYDSGRLIEFDWTRFRGIAELPKKSDDMLEGYYRILMTDVHALLDEEEKEKRMKGPRTKHRKGCDCVICENTRKSRRKRQEEDPSQPDEKDKSDTEEPDNKTAKTSGKLLGLVTAQKLRVRLGIHEACRQVDSSAGEAVMKKLESQKGHVKDLPHWWKSGYHDRALMLGTAFHGVGQWQDIWEDATYDEFHEIFIKYGIEMKYPTNQAAMKRLREVSSLILSELRRDAKRNAKLEREIRRDARRKARSSGAKPPLPPGHCGRRSKPGREAQKRSGDEYEDVPEHVHQASDDGGSTVEESGSEDEVDVMQNNTRMTLPEDESRYDEGDGMEVDEDATEDESNDEGPPDSYAATPNSRPTDQMSTEEEDEGEERVVYDSATESGSD